MMRPAMIAIASVCVLAGAACDRDTVGNGPATRPNAEDRGTATGNQGGPTGSSQSTPNGSPGAARDSGGGLVGGGQGSVAGDRDINEDRATQLPSSQQGVTAQTSFDIVDQNDDGVVSREEASTVDGLDFAAADADESASLTRQEYALAMEKARPRG